MKTPIDWLKKEVPVWVKEALITRESGERLLARYESAAKKNYSVIILSILGAGLIGLGIISVFASNWEHIPRVAKAGIALILLLGAQAVLIFGRVKHKESLSFSEAGTLFLLIAFTGALAIVAQTYHLGGNLYDFVKTVVLLSIALIYIFNSVTVAFVLWWVIVGLLDYTANVHGVFYDPLIWLLFLIWLPWYIQRFVRAPYSSITHAFNVSVAIGVVSFLNLSLVHYGYGASESDILILNMAFAGIIWIVYRLIYSSDLGGFNRVGDEISKLVLCLFMLVLSSFSESTSGRYYMSYQLSAQTAFFLFLLVVLLGVYVYRKRDELVYLIIPVFTIFTWLLISASFEHTDVLFSLYTVLTGVVLLVFGARRNSLVQANQGLILIVVLALIKFVDSELSLLYKGIAFILVGIGFFSINIAIKKLMGARQ
ncbi:MAG: DUF2157 domain-containing protein [Helicobacteraceae bacterium]|jgi:uncharacterized membrane protein|nr:DUF2157 domain-containing protein [Helicobacteraceae bacterium]